MAYRRITGRVKFKVKTGDTVQIIAGKDKGERGRVIKVDRKRGTVLVEGLTKDKEGRAVPLNAVTKHRKPRNPADKGERMRVPAPLHISKIMVIDPHTNEPTRVGRRWEDRRLVRYSKRSGETIDVK